MKRTNKAGEWHELMVISEGELFGPQGHPAGSAVRATYARYGREFRFSHTLGVIREGGFHPIQHIHDRNMVDYVVLLECSAIVVVAAKKTSVEIIRDNPALFKTQMRSRIEQDELIQKSRESIEKPKKRKKVQPVSKPGFGASIGDMLKSKQ